MDAPTNQPDDRVPLLPGGAAAIPPPSSSHAPIPCAPEAVALVVDTSGSVAPILPEILSAANAFLAAYATLPGPRQVSVVLFASKVKPIVWHQPHTAVAPLTKASIPSDIGGSTALYIAIVEVVAALLAVKEATVGTPPVWSLLLYTDGQNKVLEPYSHQHAAEAIRKAEAQNIRVQFICDGVPGLAASLGVASAINVDSRMGGRGNATEAFKTVTWQLGVTPQDAPRPNPMPPPPTAAARIDEQPPLPVPPTPPPRRAWWRFW